MPNYRRIFVWPPEDQLQFHGYLWQLEKAMYGLRVAPKSWQEHFAEVLQRHNYKRGQYEACVFYYDSDENPLYALVHVDDILTVGATKSYESFRKILGENFLVKDVGSLNNELSKIGFLGRLLTRTSDEIHVRSSLGYIEGLFDILKPSKANSTETTGSNSTKPALDADTALSPQDHSLYRTGVGKLQFLVPIRPDVAYSVKELARDLALLLLIRGHDYDISVDTCRARRTTS
jgi:hypothetical protein